MINKKLNANSLSVLMLLSDLKCYSGNEIAKALSISRTAVWKHINGLKSHGYLIKSHQSKGYQLRHPLTPLLREKIENNLKLLSFEERIEIECYPQVNSTNTLLKERLAKPDLLEVVLTEQQFLGRGRFNREWHSPFGENIYLSLKKKLIIPFSSLSGFSLCISLALIEGLIAFGIPSDDLSIKWPNDLLLNGKKLAGILIELSGEVGAGAEAIIGVGMNVMMQEASIDKKWTSLSHHFNYEIDRNALVAQLISAIAQTTTQFETQGFTFFKEKWACYDVLKGEKIDLYFYDKKISGECLGIDETGNILIKQKDATVNSYAAGEVSFQQPS